MTKNNLRSKQQRLGEIEDRKIEILLEIGNVHDNDSKKVSQLKTEYARLDKEYYHLQIELIKKKKMICIYYNIISFYSSNLIIFFFLINSICK